MKSNCSIGSAAAIRPQYLRMRQRDKNMLASVTIPHSKLGSHVKNIFCCFFDFFHNFTQLHWKRHRSTA
jgi:hypothetical protein